MVPERFTVETAMPELPLLCRVELFGWECARERKIISALVDIPEFCRHSSMDNAMKLTTNHVALSSGECCVRNFSTKPFVER